jgi:CHAT domain-containing protein
VVNTHSIVSDLNRLTLLINQYLKEGQDLSTLLLEAEELIQRTQRFGVVDLVAVAFIRKADILIGLGDYPAAAKILLKAQKSLGDLRQPDLGVSILVRLAECSGKQAKWDETLLICEEGIHLVERFRYKVSGPYMQSGYLQSRIQLYQWGVRAALEQKDYERMLAWMELSKGRGTLRYLSSDAKGELPSKEMQVLQSEFEKLNRQIDAVGGSLSEKSPNPRLGPLLIKRRMIWDQIAIRRYQEITGSQLPVFDVRTVQNCLEVSEAVVYYYWLDSLTLLVMTLDQDCVQSQIITISEEQRNDLEKTARNLQVFDSKMGWNTLSRKFSYLLPDLNRLVNKKRLIFSPHKLLHALPFHVLRWEKDYLLRRYAVSYIPNLSVLLLKAPPRSIRNTMIIAVGQFAVKGFKQDDLPFAEIEADRVAALHRRENRSVVMITGSKVRDEAIKRLFTQYGEEGISCLHWVTHGANISEDAPLESFLSLYDSLLDGLEISNFRLFADLVVLSACSTGQRSFSARRQAELQGDEILGLQTAFAAAGCRKILSSLWPVEDSVALAIMEGFHEYRLQGLPDDVSLQRSILNYIDNKENIAFRSLRYWAPFFIARFRY